jgi:hypothetical protein
VVQRLQQRVHITGGALGGEGARVEVVVEGDSSSTYLDWPGRPCRGPFSNRSWPGTSK